MCSCYLNTVPKFQCHCPQLNLGNAPSAPPLPADGASPTQGCLPRPLIGSHSLLRHSPHQRLLAHSFNGHLQGCFQHQANARPEPAARAGHSPSLCSRLLPDRATATFCTVVCCVPFPTPHVLTPVLCHVGSGLLTQDYELAVSPLRIPHPILVQVTNTYLFLRCTAKVRPPAEPSWGRAWKRAPLFSATRMWKSQDSVQSGQARAHRVSASPTNVSSAKR